MAQQTANLAIDGLSKALHLNTDKKTQYDVVRQAKYQADYGLDMWNRQNLYNSPKEQMKRLIEAGLNPHLMYGQGTVGNAQTPSMPTQPKPASPGGYQKALFQNPAMNVNPFQQYHTFRNLGAQTNNTEEITKNMAQQTANLAIDGLSKALHLNTDKKTQYDVVRQAKYQADAAFQNSQNLIKQGRLIGAQEQNAIKQLKLIGQQLKNATKDGEIKALIKDIRQEELNYKRKTGTTDPGIWERILFESGIYEWIMEKWFKNTNL